MNIDEVLLTKEEIAKLAYDYSENMTTGDEVLEALKVTAKAAQLKLLEWLILDCDNPSHYVVQNELSYSRYDCYECMSELKAKLKEG